MEPRRGDQKLTQGLPSFLGLRPGLSAAWPSGASGAALPEPGLHAFRLPDPPHEMPRARLGTFLRPVQVRIRLELLVAKRRPGSTGLRAGSSALVAERHSVYYKQFVNFVIPIC